MKAYIAGYHGMKNLGDDYFLKFIVQQLQNRGYKTIYVSAIHDNLPHLESCDGCTVRGVLPLKSIIRGYGQWISMLHYSLKSDVLVFCAGSIFTILPFKLINYILRLSKIVNPKLTIVGVGISVGPFHSLSDQVICNKIFSKFDAILVRDRKSIDYLDDKNKNKVFLSRDLAYTYRLKLNNFFHKRSPCTLGIALNDYQKIFSSDLGNENIRNEKIIEAIMALKQEGVITKVILYATCTNDEYGDIRVTEYMLNRLQSIIETEVIVYEQDVDLFIVRLTECEILIASRLHAGFFGYLNGLKVLQLVYAEKTASFYENIDHDQLILCDAYDFETKDIIRIITEMKKRDFPLPHPLSSFTLQTKEELVNFLNKYIPTGLNS